MTVGTPDQTEWKARRQLRPARVDRQPPQRPPRKMHRRTLVIAAIAALTVLVTALLGAAGHADTATWWLLNANPPQVSITAPPNVQRGAVTVQVAVAPGARARLSLAALDGAALAMTGGLAGLPGAAGAPGAPGEILDAGLVSASPESLQSFWAWWEGLRNPRESDVYTLRLETDRVPDGAHTIRVDVEDLSRNRNRASAEVAIRTDNTAPVLTPRGVPPRLLSGRIAAVRVSTNEPAEVRFTWGTDAVPLLSLTGAGSGAGTAIGAGTGIGTGQTSGPAAGTAPNGVPGAEMIALVAAPVNSSAGEGHVQLTARDEAGNLTEQAVTIPLDAVNLPRQNLIVPASLAPLATGPVAVAESGQIIVLTSPVRPERLWDGPFRAPFPEAPRTTGFGDRRDYVDGYITYHGGYDEAAPFGAPIGAAASGVVVFSGRLAQRGNAVIVDHGWGVYTVYGHMDSIQVPMGQAVTAGQTLGLVGTTGLSTGPHLHWEVRLRGLAVDPGAWLALSRELS